MNPGDSVLLPISMIPGYLDEALKALALHTEARTSFITLRILSFSWEETPKKLTTIFYTDFGSRTC